MEVLNPELALAIVVAVLALVVCLTAMILGHDEEDWFQ